jgi:hypothetical protein
MRNTGTSQALSFTIGCGARPGFRHNSHGTADLRHSLLNKTQAEMTVHSSLEPAGE